jgi:hypothetical protein
MAGRARPASRNNRAMRRRSGKFISISAVDHPALAATLLECVAAYDFFLSLLSQAKFATIFLEAPQLSERCPS